MSLGLWGELTILALVLALALAAVASVYAQTVARAERLLRKAKKSAAPKRL